MVLSADASGGPRQREPGHHVDLKVSHVLCSDRHLRSQALHHSEGHRTSYFTLVAGSTL
jgi:hypothetical protein